MAQTQYMYIYVKRFHDAYLFVRTTKVVLTVDSHNDDNKIHNVISTHCCCNPTCCLNSLQLCSLDRKTKWILSNLNNILCLHGVASIFIDLNKHVYTPHEQYRTAIQGLLTNN